MSYIQAIIASISSSTGGSGGGGGGASPTFKSWTIEWWMKKLSPQTNSVPRVFAAGVDSAASLGYSNESGGDYFWSSAAPSGPIAVGSIANSWTHMSVNSDGTNLYVFKNGTSLFSGPRAGTPIVDSSTPFYLGGDTSNHWKGRITDFHIMKGSCKYTQPGSAPAGRLTADAHTVLLLQFPTSSFNPTVGPAAANISTATWNADDPWADPAGGSVAFNGTSGSFMNWAGDAIFALDV